MTHKGQELTTRSSAAAVRQAVREAVKEGVSPKHVKALKGLIKVIKRAGIGVACLLMDCDYYLDVMDCLQNPRPDCFPSWKPPVCEVQDRINLRTVSWRPRMNSDGIAVADWHRVHELAVNVANAGDDEDRGAEARIALRSFLAQLRVRYGEKPSILATEADYEDRPEESRDLLVRAYELATAISDRANLKETSLSLADLHVTELHDLAEARRWLATSRQWIDATDELDWDEYRSIERSIAVASE